MPDTTIEERIAGLEGVRAELLQLRTEMRTYFRWTASMLLINWLTLLVGICLLIARK